mmetsp:Transcript_11890/g.23686  ORF Transcript_11890/g.23686 Transcript_11890/m.23686 type:complete len:221 (-) Transcript_11890:156-818(-)
MKEFSDENCSLVCSTYVSTSVFTNATSALISVWASNTVVSSCLSVVLSSFCILFSVFCRSNSTLAVAASRCFSRPSTRCNKSVLVVVVLNRRINLSCSAIFDASTDAFAADAVALLAISSRSSLIVPLKLTSDTNMAHRRIPKRRGAEHIAEKTNRRPPARSLATAAGRFWFTGSCISSPTLLVAPYRLGERLSERLSGEPCRMSLVSERFVPGKAGVIY